MTNIVKRKCIVTNEIVSTDELIRIVKLKDGNYEINNSAKGRGAYVKNDVNLIETIRVKKVLNRSFKTQVPNHVYDELEKIIRG